MKAPTIPIAQFHSHLSGVSYQDASTTATYLHIILQFFLTKEMINPFLTAMWDHMDGYVNQYCCASAIYILSCIALEFSVIIDISVVAPVHGKDMDVGINSRDKRMLKLEIAELLNLKLVRYYPIF